MSTSEYRALILVYFEEITSLVQLLESNSHIDEVKLAQAFGYAHQMRESLLDALPKDLL